MFKNKICLKEETMEGEKSTIMEITFHLKNNMIKSNILLIGSQNAKLFTHYDSLIGDISDFVKGIERNENMNRLVLVVDDIDSTVYDAISDFWKGLHELSWYQTLLKILSIETEPIDIEEEIRPDDENTNTMLDDIGEKLDIIIQLLKNMK